MYVLAGCLIVLKFVHCPFVDVKTDVTELTAQCWCCYSDALSVCLSDISALLLSAVPGSVQSLSDDLR